MIYVLSDIHGNLRRFNSVMEQINLKQSDTLYILGDVIDRYPDGIKILQKIMKMKNAQMLLGNHEYMKGIVRHLPEMWTEWFSNPLNGPDRFKGSTYYVDFENLRFIVIDTNGLQRLSDYTTVLTWLNRTLCEAGSRYTVVMMHHPVLSGAVGRQNMVIKVAFYDALNKADIVFSGHDHNYTRRLPFIGTNSAKKFYLSKVNHKDTRICSGKQLYNVLTLCNDTLTIETFLMDSGEKYDEIQVIHHTNNERQYIDNWSGKKEIIELPEKYEKRHNIKVSKFYRRRNLRMAKDTIL